MKLLKLTIHNLASIQDAQINFDAEPLNSKDLFLITGKTGSGKSTILDAICLALYGQTPRLANSRANEETIGVMDGIKIDKPENLLRRGTKEGYAALAFEGNNDVRYEARWSVKRIKTNPVTRSLTNLDTDYDFGTKQKTIEDELKRAIGLTYEQFCRTSMLAQGEFTRFLKANNDEKADILEKILGKDIFRTIGDNIGKLYARKKKAKEEAEMKMEGIPALLTDEQIAECTVRIGEIETANRQLDDDKKAIQAALDAIEAIANADTAITVCDNRIQGEYKELFVRILQGLHFLQDSIAEKERCATELEGRIAAEEERKNAYENAQTIISLLGSIQAANTLIRNQQDAMAADEGKRAHLEQAKSDAGKAFDEAEEAWNTANRALAAQEAEIAKLDLPNLRTRKGHVENLIRLIQSAIAYKEAQQKGDAMREPIAAAMEKEQACKAILDQQTAIADTNAQVLRNHLAIGQPCPVCGCEVTTLDHVMHDALVKQMLSAAQEAYDNAEKDRKQLEKAQQDLNISGKEQVYARDLRALVNAPLHAAEEQVLETVKACYAAAADHALIAKLQQMEQVETALRNTLGAQITSGESREEASKTQRRTLTQQRTYIDSVLRKALQDAEKAVSECNSRIQTVKGIIKAKNEDIERAQSCIAQLLGATPWDNDWRVSPEAFADELRRLTAAYTALVRELEHIRQTLPQETRNRDSVQRQTDHIRRLLPEWQTLSEDGKRVYKEIVSDVSALSIRIENDLEAKQKARQSKEEHERLLDAFCAQHAEAFDRQDPALKERLAAEKGAKEEATGINNQLIGSIRKELQTNADHAAQFALFEAQKAAAVKELNRWQKLYDLLGGSEGAKFKKIALSFVLYDLIQEANKRLEELNPRYTLNVELGTYVIFLEDAYDDYSRSPVTTLSGGESFLVSLALALALSEFGGRQLRVDPLFIDEGFGTLSEELLDNAVDTLRAWSKSDRRIGIISHIESLQNPDCIPVQIRVKKGHKSSASTIEIVES